jgi:hypothetical protein
MTEKEIVRLAEEAELWLHSDRKYEAVKKFAELVAEAEREACAKTAMELLFVYIGSYPINEQFADAIRARGEHGSN